MRLKKLELHGFKSFADRVVLNFDEGITGVVGPNGCGKSNISDAFRWVLGEQSAKSLRGGKMHDVIFAGTSTRAPLAFAEVTITFTDVAGSLPVEYEEVAVTRRLHRSGESEYLLNRQPVRLKDIRSLFLDSGIGKISIFEQGKIDDIIRSSPLERRRIFEAAAGILRFLERKQEATRDLGKTDDNMTRILDIYAEVAKQIEVSEKQAEAAKAYKSNVSELEILEKALLLAKYARFDERMQQVTEKENELVLILSNSNGLLRLLTVQLDEARIVLDESETVFRKRSEAVYQARSSRAISQKERQANQDRLKEAIAKEAEYSKQLAALRSKREDGRVVTEHSKTRLNALEKDVLLQEEALQMARKTATKAETELAALRVTHREAQAERIQLVQDEAKAESQLKENKARLEGAQERLADLASRHAQGKKWGDELQSELGVKEKTLKEVSEQVDTKRALMEQLDGSLQTLNKELETKAAERELFSTELAEVKARQQALRKLKEEMEGLSSATKALIRESQDPASPVHGKLRLLHEELRPKQGYEAAVAAVIRPYLQTLLVDTEADLRCVLEVAAELELTDFSILCLESLTAPLLNEMQAGNVTPLIEHVLEHSLASQFLGDAALTDSEDGVMSLAVTRVGGQIVSPKGVLRDLRGVLFFTAQGEHNAFLREAELRTLELRFEELTKGLEKLIEALGTLQRKKAEFDIQRAEIDQGIRRSEMKLVEANFGVQQCRQALAKHEQEFGAMDAERTRLQQVVNELEASIKDLTRQHENYSIRAQERASQLVKLERDLKKAEELFKDADIQKQDLESSYRKASQELQHLAHSLKVYNVKEEESVQQEERLMHELSELKALQDKINAAEAIAAKAMGTVEEELTGVEAEVKALEDQVIHWKGRIKHIEANLGATREKVRVAEDERHQISVKVAQIGSQREVIQQELFERHAMTVEEAQALDLKLDQPIEEAEKRVRTLRRDIERAGDVNMTAIDAYEEQKQRHVTLKRQIKDMETAKKELMEIIGELDGESRKIFRETFATIRENFQKNFKILFNGGEADLTFTESNDVLEAGIEIVAKPPGKRMRSIQLLSGGEKCLTAMALLFAIFEVKPAPFCILDEIDAPLDDSNVVRFVNVVKQFVDRSQFIIITHNKRTMAIADTLFGVSMEERGVSKLLSMKFSEAAEHAESELETAVH